MYLQLLAVAIGVALSPVIIFPFVRVVFSEHRAAAVPAFVGTVAALCLLTPLLLARTLAAADGVAPGHDGPTALGVAVFAVLAIALLALAAKNLRKHGAAADEPQAPSGGSVTPRAAVGLAAAVVLVNPKVLAFFLGAASVIGEETDTLREAVLAAAAFAAFAAGPIGAVAAYQAVGGEQAATRIAAAQSWMARNDAAIKAAVLLVLGGFFAVKAITGLVAL